MISSEERTKYSEVSCDEIDLNGHKKELAKCPTDVVLDSTDSSSSSSFSSIYQKDCYLLFRALCKLSMKGQSDDRNNDSIALQNKSVTVDLLLIIILSII